MIMFDISYLWDTGKINTRVTNTTNFIDRDHDGTPYILAPIQHGVRLFDKSGNDVWSYSGITQGYDVRDIAVGDLFETGFNDSCVVASGYYSTSKTFAVIDKDGNAQAFTPSTGYQCNRVLIKDTDIYLCGNTFVTKYVKDGTAWVEDLAGWAKSIGEAKDMVIADAGNGERLFVSSYGDRKVYSYLLDGTPEWASSIGAYGGNIAVGKIDTTRPGLQVVVTHQNGIRVFDKDGGILSTISSPGSNVRTGLVLYDCDADGEDEIYFTDMGNNIFCLDRSGSSYITKYSSNGAYTTSAGLINFDINKDGKDELVAGTQNGKMLILSPELEILSTIDTGLGNVVAGGFYYNYVFLSNGTRFPDIDGDGYPDLIFSVSSGAVYAYKITSASTPLEDYEGDVSIAANGIVFSLGEKSVGFSLSTAGIGGLTRQGIKSSMGSINLSGTCRVVVDGFRPIDGYIVERRIGDGEWQ